MSEFMTFMVLTNELRIVLRDEELGITVWELLYNTFLLYVADGAGDGREAPGGGADDREGASPRDEAELGQGPPHGRPQAGVDHARGAPHLAPLAQELLRALYPSSALIYISNGCRHDYNRPKGQRNGPRGIIKDESRNN